MFQAVAFSIVLTLAVGQNAALLCNVWCYPHEAAATVCHHQDAAESPSVTGGDHCNNVVLPAFLREDVRPRVSAPDVQHARVVRRFELASVLSDVRGRYEPGRDGSPQQRPLAITLRI